MLGRLFTNNNDERTKTEIVLLITPYVVRNVDRPAPSALEVASGTEGSLGAAPLRLRSGTGGPLAFSAHQRAQPIPGQASEVKPPPGSETPRPAPSSELRS